MPRALFVSAAAHQRLEQAEAFLAERRRDERVLVVGATLEAAASLTRRVALQRGASFGWHRSTLGRAALSLAAPLLEARGLAPVGAFPLEAIATRVVTELSLRGALGRFQSVAHFPGLPRALCRTLAELRAFGLDSQASADGARDLLRIHRAFEEELDRCRLADRAIVFRLATLVAQERSLGPARATVDAILDRPLLLVDAAVPSVLERGLVAALAARSPDVLATVPLGDTRSLDQLSAALEIEPTRLRIAEGAGDPLLARQKEHLFAPDLATEAPSGGTVEILSAPGESRECVEIARAIQAEAARGIAFDRMAILLRAPNSYRAHLEEALRRASIPAHFARGTIAPDPAGRAFVALLACAVEKLSARRFAEYLSLGQVPNATAEGEPPEEVVRDDRFEPADDDDFSPRRPDDSEEDDSDDTAADPSSPTQSGTLRAPWRWERLVVESAVVGGLERWVRRLDALERKLTLELDPDPGEPSRSHIEKRLADLAALRRFAMPLLRDLADLPAEGSWGLYLDRLSALATRALRRPARVLSVLTELEAMGSVSPVTLAELVRVVSPRLTSLVVRPTTHSAGKVFVAPIELARGLSFSVVFVPGLAERIFPQKVSEEPILRDRDRALIGLPTNDDRIREERLALRLAIGAAESRLVLSYPRVDMDQSRPRVPSFYALELVRAAEGTLPSFDELARRAEEKGGARIGWPAPSRPELAIDESEYDLSLLERLFQLPEQESIGTAHYLLAESSHLARALRGRARRWTIKKWMPVDGLVDPGGLVLEALARHRTTARSYSPTALEAFASCPYRFYLRAIQRLEPREVPAAVEELDPRSRGTLMHEVMCEVLRVLREQRRLPLSDDGLAHAQLALEEVLVRLAGRFKDELAPTIDRVWDDAIARIRGDLREWLRRLSQEKEFLPDRFELSFGIPLTRDRSHDATSCEAPCVLDCGLSLAGSIDLVERSHAGVLRATDYKTGKPLDLQKAVVTNGGTVLQPLFYALALEKLFPESSVASGRLYYTTSAGGFTEVHVPLNDAARDAADVVARVVGDAIAEGFLPAAPAPEACATCPYERVCGPYEELRTARKNKERLARLFELRGLP